MKNLLYFSALLAFGIAAEGSSYNYTDQSAWINISATCGGNRQSPIAIDTNGLREGNGLIDLVLRNWNVERKGILENSGGHTIKFTPNESEGSATTTNHQGDYTLLQFHVHWGGTDSEGSEHVVDGEPASAEIHFVHRRNSGLDTAGNAFAVVGVMAVADSGAKISGVWNQLSIFDVQEYDSKADATVRFSDFLPSNISYYYYEGSLTTPPCSEVVQWFLLKEPIKIPGEFLEELRKVEHTEDKEPLTFNFRETQALNVREVTVHSDDELFLSTLGAAISAKPFTSLILLSIFLLALLI